MDWSKIIADLLKDVLPLLVDALKRWLEKLLPQAAKELAVPNRNALIEKAIEMTPPRQFIKRGILRVLRDSPRGLGKDAKAEIRGLAKNF